MPTLLNGAYLLESSNGSGDKRSRPFWWPGGDGELNAHGTVGGTLILHVGAPQLSINQRADKDNYKPQGSTVTDITAGLADRFWAAAGWMYVELENTGGNDDCKVWVSRIPNGENLEPYYDTENTTPVS